MARTFAKLLTEDFNLGVSPATKPNPGGGTLTGTQIGIHSFAVGVAKVTLGILVAFLPPLQKDISFVTVPGASLGDFVMVSSDLNNVAGLMVYGYVSAPDTVSVVIFNLNQTVLNLPSIVVSVLVFKSK